MNEITFIIADDDVDGGFSARAHWPDGNRDIFTEGDTREELIENIREALELSFDDKQRAPSLIHLDFVRDEVISR